MLAPGVEGACKTVGATRNISALLNFLPHIVGNGFIRSACRDFIGTEIYSRRERIYPFRMSRFCRHSNL